MKSGYFLYKYSSVEHYKLSQERKVKHEIPRTQQSLKLGNVPLFLNEQHMLGKGGEDVLWVHTLSQAYHVPDLCPNSTLVQTF